MSWSWTQTWRAIFIGLVNPEFRPEALGILIIPALSSQIWAGINRGIAFLDHNVNDAVC